MQEGHATVTTILALCLLVAVGVFLHGAVGGILGITGVLIPIGVGLYALYRRVETAPQRDNPATLDLNLTNRASR